MGLEFYVMETVKKRHSVFPTHQVAYEGTNINMACKSDSRPFWEKNGMQLNWYSDEHYISNVNNSHDNKFKWKAHGIPFTADMWLLIMVNVKSKDTGTYSCIGYHNNEQFNTTSTLIVGNTIENFWD